MSLKWTLLLFDHDGFTTVCETKKLKKLDGSNITDVNLVSKADQVKCVFGKGVFLAEVLELADTKSVLNNFETNWLNSHRAISIQQEQDLRHASHQNVHGGYLKIWPAETDNTTEQIPVVTPEEPAAATHEADSDNEETRPTKIRRLSPQIKEGTNGRKITVLYQGSGETPGEVIEPKRKPCFTKDLTVDQTDIVANQVKNTNQTSAFIQTDDVLLFSNTQEFLSYYSQAMKEQPTPNTTSAEIPSDANKHNKTCATTQTQTQPSIIFSQLSKGTKEMSTQTPDTPESTSTIEKKLEELLNTQNTILQMLRRQNDGNISDILNLTNSIPDLLDNNEPDQQRIVKYIIKYPSSEETKQQSDVNNQTAVSSDILSSAAESSD